MLKDRVYDKSEHRNIMEGVLMRLFKSLIYEPDLEWGNIVKAHQYSTGARTEDDEGIGKSIAGNTTKILVAVDSYGLPIEFHDSKAAPTLIDMLPSSDYIIADRGYDSEALRE